MSKIKKNPIGSDFDESLDLDLRDPVAAAYFINAAAELNDPEYFKEALGRVAKAYGVASIAGATGFGRESIYKMIDKKGNPGFSSIMQILNACGLELAVKPKGQKLQETPSVSDVHFADFFKGSEGAAFKKEAKAWIATEVKAELEKRVRAINKTSREATPARSAVRATKKIANFR